MKKYIPKIMESPLFGGIEEPDMEKMLACMNGKVKTYHKGEIIFLMNEELRYVGVLIEGSVHMVKENSQGDKTLLSVIRKGEVFGESFACGDERFAYTTFVVVEKATVLFMPFHKVMHSCTLPCIFHHRLIENMVTMIANKNVRLMEKIDVSSQKTLREKVLSYLRLQIYYQKQNPVTLDVNRTVLAEYLDANRSALARELSLMKKEGILDFEKNRFYLKEE